LKLSVFFLLLCSSFLAFLLLTLRRHRGYDLFIQAYRNPDNAVHQQVQRIWKLYILSLFAMTIGRLLGNDWKSGFYVLHMLGAITNLIMLWHQGELSDRLAQNRSNENQP
jgi:hypothetical protein